MARVSIITINLNNGPGLEKTIASVGSQVLKPAEFIIIDGGSNDDTLSIISKNGNKISRWISEKDHGIYDAMNKGVDMATGEFLLFLNSGDRLADNSVLAEIDSELNQAGIIYGDLITIDHKGKKEKHKSFKQANVYSLMISTIWHPCAFIEKNLFGKFGKYNPDFRIAGDYEFFVRTILANGVKSKYVERTIAMFDTGGVSGKEENKRLMEEERERAWKLNFSDPMIEFFKEGVQLSRSRELQIGKLISRFLP